VTLFLHNPASQAHIEDLRDRLGVQLARASQAGSPERADLLLIDRLILVVRSMDQGSLTPKDALQMFASHPVPGFSFGKWLVEMVDEGIYLEDLFNEAA
jgi:hypothetical protein